MATSCGQPVEKPVQAFVSFSGRNDGDRYFGGAVLSRLRECGLDAWIYEHPGEHIETGACILESCLDKIRESQVVVVVISDSSLGSPYTQEEVRFAFEQQAVRQLRVFPVCTTRFSRESWPDPYKKFSGRLTARVDLNDAAAREDVIRTLCDECDVEYAPPDVGGAGLPMARRIEYEIRSAQAKGNGGVNELNGLRHQLRAAARSAGERYRDGDLKLARHYLDHLILTAEQSFEVDSFYYCYIARASIAAELGELETAEVEFRRLLEPSAHPRIDENAAGGLGGVLILRDRPHDAFYFFRLADEMVRRDGRDDPDITFNLLLSSILMGEPPRVELINQLERCATLGIVAERPGQLSRVRTLLALSKLCQTGRIELTEIGSDAESTIDLLIEFVRQLDSRFERTGDESCRAQAETLLRQALDAPLSAPSEVQVRHRLARLRFVSGDWDDAAHHLRLLTEQRPAAVQFWVELAMATLLSGGEDWHDHARQAAAFDLFSATDGVGFPGNQCDRERHFHYYAGFAQYLLNGDCLAAHFRFELSQRDADEWYANVLRG
jgi:Flp pilus assembly protein TadD